VQRTALKFLLDCGPAAVETVTRKQVDAGEQSWGDPESVDASKVLLVMAREALKGDKKALAYLPEIRPVRIDYTDTEAPELIFSMPAYKVMDEVPAGARPPLAREIARSLNMHVTGQGTLAQAVAAFLRDVQSKNFPEVVREAPHIVKALQTLDAMTSRLKLSKNRADIHEGNMAFDAAGHFVILDPLVAEAKFADVENLWQKQGWPGGPLGARVKRTTKR
jgi:hypothetical protein